MTGPHRRRPPTGPHSPRAVDLLVVKTNPLLSAAFLGTKPLYLWALMFLRLQGSVKKPFSTEPCNLKNINAQRYNGLVPKKAVGISAAADNKGFVFTTKRSTATNKPAKNLLSVTMKAGAGRSLHRVKGALLKQRYRKDLSKAALKRASAIINSQKPLPKRKEPRPPRRSKMFM